MSLRRRSSVDLVRSEESEGSTEQIWLNLLKVSSDPNLLCGKFIPASVSQRDGSMLQHAAIIDQRFWLLCSLMFNKEPFLDLNATHRILITTNLNDALAAFGDRLHVRVI